MPKYYVESNDLKVVLVANKPLEACVKAMSLLLNKTPKELSNLALGEKFVVSERGFVCDRKPFIIDTENEHIIDTDKVIDCL
tara:strand:+ start:634 stop:879 length:246 start_codon:yes stop_codon:yes gene_type:complete